jgi:hypothetical protein
MTSFIYVGFEVFTAVTIKDFRLLDVAPCRFIIHGLTLSLARVISTTLKMEATCSSETSVYSKPTRRHIPEDGQLHIVQPVLRNVFPSFFENSCLLSGNQIF